MFNFPDFDVVGLILRPEDDGRFTILGVADLEGKPSVPEVACSLAIIWSRSMASRLAGLPWDRFGPCWEERRGRSADSRSSAAAGSSRSRPRSNISWRNCRTRKKRRSSSEVANDSIYFGVAGAANTSFSRAAVVAASRLSLTNTVSPCSSITTAPSSVVQAWRPFSRSILDSAFWCGGFLRRGISDLFRFLVALLQRLARRSPQIPRPCRHSTSAKRRADPEAVSARHLTSGSGLGFAA